MNKLNHIDEKKHEINVLQQDETLNEIKTKNKDFLTNVVKKLYELDNIIKDTQITIQLKDQTGLFDTKTVAAVKIGAAGQLIKSITDEILNNNNYDLNWNICKFWKSNCCKFSKNKCKFIHLDDNNNNINNIYQTHCPFEEECILNGINCNCAEKIRIRNINNNNNNNNTNLFNYNTLNIPNNDNNNNNTLNNNFSIPLNNNYNTLPNINNNNSNTPINNTGKINNKNGNAPTNSARIINKFESKPPLHGIHNNNAQTNSARIINKFETKPPIHGIHNNNQINNFNDNNVPNFNNTNSNNYNPNFIPNTPNFNSAPITNTRINNNNNNEPNFINNNKKQKPKIENEEHYTYLCNYYSSKCNNKRGMMAE